MVNVDASPSQLPSVDIDITGADILAGMGRGDAILPQSAAGRSKQIQYWKKCTGCSYHIEELGWVTTGPVMSPRTSIEYTEFQANKHSTPLDIYGQWTIGKVNGQKYDLTDPPRRFQAIIELGGINEFPLDQMQAYNWHRFPIMTKVRPELLNVVEIPCVYGCSNRKFVGQDSYNNHINVMHKDVMAPEAMGRSLQAAISTMNTNNQMNPETLASIVTAVMAAYDNKFPRVEPKV